MKRLFIYLVIVFLCQIINAQIEQMILPSDMKQETVITEPATIRKGFLRTGIFASYGVVDKMFNDKWEKKYIPGSNGWASSWSYQASVMYGVTDRLMLGLEIPYMHERYFMTNEIVLPGLDSTFVLESRVNAIGLSDIDFSVDYQMIYLNEGKTSLKAQVYITLPTGRKNPENIVNSTNYDKPTGLGYVSIDTRLAFRQIVYPYSFSGYASYKYNLKGSKIHYPGEEEVSFRDGANLYLGGSFNVHLNDWIAFMNEIAFSTWSKDTYDAITSADVKFTGRYLINYQPSLVFQVRRFRFFEVVQFPLKGKNTGADPGYVFGLQYTF
jgi:hypothetical protein